MKIIKSITATAFLFACCLQICAQTVISDVWAEEQNRHIAVHYTLTAEQPADLSLQYSTDDGSTWFDCKSVAGDLQSQITGDKTIVWDCLQDGFESGSLLFKVIVNVQLSVSPKELSFPASGGTASVDVTTNADNYDVASLPDWCLVINKNAGGFNIQCKSWDENAPREAYFDVTALDKSERISLMQSAAPVQDTISVPVQPTYIEPAPENQTALSTGYKKSVSKPDIRNGARKTHEWGTFLDIGICNVNFINLFEGRSYPSRRFFDIGLGGSYTYNFSPFIGWNVATLKIQSLSSTYLLQAMTGLRAYAPAVKGYASLKAGYGYDYDDSSSSGFTYELEIGIHLTKSLFAGFVYNSQQLLIHLPREDLKRNCSYAGLRIGVNF